MCCLRCVVGCVSVGVDALAVVWWGRFKKKSVITKKKSRDGLFTTTVLINSKQFGPASNYEYYGFLFFRKKLQHAFLLSFFPKWYLVRVHGHDASTVKPIKKKTNMTDRKEGQRQKKGGYNSR